MDKLPVWDDISADMVKQMDAGEEIDALVALALGVPIKLRFGQVMGQKLINVGTQGRRTVLEDWFPVNQYSTRPKFAYLLREKMREAGWLVDVSNTPPKYWPRDDHRIAVVVMKKVGDPWCDDSELEAFGRTEHHATAKAFVLWRLATNG